MALTKEEEDQREQDRIVTLIATLTTLRSKPGDPAYPDNMNPAITALQEIADFSNSSDNKRRAKEAVDAVGNEVMDAALNDLAAVAKQMGPAGAELNNAREIAAGANRDLTLPKIASVSAVALASLENLLEAVKKFNAGDLDESAAAMEVTVENLKKLMDSLPNT